MSKNKSPHITRGNVLDDLGFAPDVAFELKVKSELHSAILKLIRKRGYAPADLARILRIPQPRVSELKRGKLHLLGLKKLAKYAHKLGGSPKVTISIADNRAA